MPFATYDPDYKRITTHFISAFRLGYVGALSYLIERFSFMRGPCLGGVNSESILGGLNLPAPILLLLRQR